MDDASLDDFLGDGEDDDTGATPDGDEPTGESEAHADDATGEATPDDDPAADTTDGTDDTGDGDASDTTDGTEEDEEPGADASDGAAVDPEGVEPADSTYGWSSEPVACAACGDAVRRRWRDEPGLVCRDCKEW